MAEHRLVEAAERQALRPWLDAVVNRMPRTPTAPSRWISPHGVEMATCSSPGSSKTCESRKAVDQRFAFEDDSPQILVVLEHRTHEAILEIHRGPAGHVLQPEPHS